MEVENSLKKKNQKIENLKSANQVFTKICLKKPVIISKKVILEALCRGREMPISSPNTQELIIYLLILHPSKMIMNPRRWKDIGKFNPLSANPTKCSNTLKQFVGNSQQTVWVCLTIWWGWCLKDWELRNWNLREENKNSTFVN